MLAESRTEEASLTHEKKWHWWLLIENLSLQKLKHQITIIFLHLNHIFCLKNYYNSATKSVLQVERLKQPFGRSMSLFVPWWSPQTAARSALQQSREVHIYRLKSRSSSFGHKSFVSDKWLCVCCSGLGAETTVTAPGQSSSSNQIKQVHFSFVSIIQCFLDCFGRGTCSTPFGRIVLLITLASRRKCKSCTSLSFTIA